MSTTITVTACLACTCHYFDPDVAFRNMRLNQEMLAGQLDGTGRQTIV